MLAAPCNTAFLDNIEGSSTANPTILSTFPVDVPMLRNPIVSPVGTIHVLGFTPSEGGCGVPITVRIHFQPDATEALFIRLVVGQKAVATRVSEVPNKSYGRWQLDANIPPSDPQPPSKVLLSIQALNRQNEVLDSVAFGEFSYWSADTTSSRERNMVSRQPPRLQITTSIPDATALRRRSTSYRQPSRSPVSPTNTVATQQNLHLHRRMKSQSLVRTKSVAITESSDSLYAQTPILELVTPLSSVCEGWSSAEVQAGRRLVRFTKMQDGRRLIVSCKPIRQDEYCENDNVISCIYRQEIDTCFVTSVDVIYLLERLTNGEFPVEEKNRIRRNLEGLRPTTVSKHKPGFSEFFQRIMEFPDPKPRNIEKDLKVFEWNLLGQALEKILSKYSIYTTSAPDSEESTPVETPITPSPDIASANLPLSKADSNPTVLGSQHVPIPTKYERPPEDFPFISPSSASGAFSSPAGSPPTTLSTASMYPFFAVDGTELAQPADAACATWATDLKPNDLGLEALNLLSSYDGIDPDNSVVPNLSNEGASYGYSIYGGYGFNGISDQALGTMADHYQV